jgi:hypothetical protein
MIIYTQISTDRQFKASTGKSKSEFEALRIDLEKFYFEKNSQTYEAYIEERVFETPKLKNLGEALFFVLFQLKNGLTWDALSVVFGMSTATALTNFNVFLRLLEEMLEKKSDAQARF